MTVQETTLPNGLRIVTANLADAHSVAANIAVGIGSRYETFATNGGVSHFLEHLHFKGSAKYPSPQAIAEAVDAVGGWNNAYTSEDLTSYYIKVPSRHGRLALDILTDMIRSPLLASEEVDRERDVIVEEMNVWRDDPWRLVSTLLPALLFPNNPLGCDILGTEEVINTIPQTVIAEYQKRHYTPNNIVVTVAGRVKHDDIVAQVTEALGEMEPGEIAAAPGAGSDISPELAVIHAKDTAQAHFIVGSRAYAYNNADDAASKVATAILGRGMSSRLFTNVRERQGLAYTVSSDITNYTDAGCFQAYAGVNLDKIDQAIASVLHELDEIRLTPVADSELAKAKQQLIASLEMSSESNTTVADRLGTQAILLDHIEPIEDTITKIEAVTVADVQRVSQDMLAPAGLRFAIIAPEPDAAAEHFKTLVTKVGAK